MPNYFDNINICIMNKEYLKGGSKNTNNRHCEGGTTEAISTLTHIAKDCFTLFAMTGAIFRTPLKNIIVDQRELITERFKN